MTDRTILLLRLEGLALFLASLAGMACLGGGWWLFLALWLPELAVPALAWASHVGGDRALGYGLKRGSFHDTHLGPLKQPDAPTST